jgi:uncharacterized protein (TIGR00730 family)
VQQPEVIEVSAVIIYDDAGRILTVRKRGTSRFMFPGGKREPGETFRQAAARECAEEIGIAFDPGELRLLGLFSAGAANEPGVRCDETLFVAPGLVGALPIPAAEIDEIRWLDPALPLPEDAPPLVELITPQLPDRRPVKAVTLYMASAPGTNPAIREGVKHLAATLATHGLDVVYGGTAIGLMGAAADAALAAGGDVVGVIPDLRVDGGVAHGGLTRLEVVSDMAARKARLIELGDALVALPGGTGTLDEFFEAWTLAQLGTHDKPVVLYNLGGYWDALLGALDGMRDAGFVTEAALAMLVVVDNPEALIEAITRR